MPRAKKAEINPHPFRDMAERNHLLTHLRFLRADFVRVYFSGSGDSGNIDSVSVRTAKGEEIDIEKETIKWRTEAQHHDGEKWVKEVNEADDVSLDQVLRDLCHTALEGTELDWYNNDGGQGEFSIDFSVTPPKIALEVGINVTHVEENHFNFSSEE